MIRMSNYRAIGPFNVPMFLFIPETKIIKGVVKKVYGGHTMDILFLFFVLPICAAVALSDEGRGLD